MKKFKKAGLIVFTMIFVSGVVTIGNADEVGEAVSGNTLQPVQASVPSETPMLVQATPQVVEAKTASNGVATTISPEISVASTEIPSSGKEKGSINATYVEATAEATAKSMAEATAKSTVEATAEPTTEATAKSTAEATAKSTVEATAKSTVEAMAEPTMEATAEPTVEATAEPAKEATAEPAKEATAEPTKEATAEPTVEATAKSTVEATAEPTVEATAEPTTEATAEPTVEATVEVTPAPSTTATIAPSVEATLEPSATPTLEPTVEPTVVPGPAFEVTVRIVSPKEFYFSGDIIRLESVISGTCNEPSYQWQVLRANDPAKEWRDIAGANGSYYEFTVSEENFYDTYRVIVEDKAPSMVAPVNGEPEPSVPET